MKSSYCHPVEAEAGLCKSAEAREFQVPEQCQQLAKKIEVLLATIDQLEYRLMTALNPLARGGDGNKIQENQPEPALAPHALFLLSQNEYLEQALKWLDDIIERVEL